MYIQYVSGKGDNRIFFPTKISNNNIIYRRIILNIGQWKKEVEVQYLEDWPEDRIGISENMIKDFNIPDKIPYKIRFDHRNLFIGPVIGLVLSSADKTLTDEYLEKHMPYLFNYGQINGLIYICSGDRIYTENQRIEGYYFDPNKDDKGPGWVKGIFPYPDVLFRRTGLSMKKYNEMLPYMGDRIFNSYFFHKWELWQYLSPYPEIRQHLPHTEMLSGIETLNKMIDLYDKVYLKRVSGDRARGIYKAYKTEEGYHITNRYQRDKVFSNEKDASKFLQELQQEKEGYLIQQAIEMKDFENRNFDFRVVMQKDRTKQWTCSGIIVRFGGTGNISSNIGLDGFAILGKEGLQKVFNMNEKEAFAKEQEIIRICTKACEVLDQSVGNYGDLGIDVMVDKDQKVWILEINKLYYHPYPLYALNDRQMYYKIVSKPIEYASALAGF